MDTNLDIDIILLSKKYLKQGIKLVESVFDDEEESVRKEIVASVDEKKFHKYVTQIDRHTKSLEYHIAINKSEKVMAIIGFYTLIENYEDTLWIGWFCVDKRYRGKGLGKLLLEYAISEAKIRGKKYICLYTSTDANEATAQIMYEKYGFFVTKMEKKDGYDILYRKKIILK